MFFEGVGWTWGGLNSCRVSADLCVNLTVENETVSLVSLCKLKCKVVWRGKKPKCFLTVTAVQVDLTSIAWT